MGFIKTLVEKEAARLVAYASAATVALALKGAELAGVELTSEILAGIAGLTVVIVTELIRRFVYSQDTTQKIADRAADTGNTNIGEPPSGDVPPPSGSTPQG